MPEPNDGMGLIWTWVLQLTGPQGYGVAEKDIGVVVVLRHNAIPYAFTDGVWAKYKLGEVFKINDPVTKAAASRTRSITSSRLTCLPTPQWKSCLQKTSSSACATWQSAITAAW